MNREKVYNLISGLGITVYPDYIPQSKNLPAVSYTLVSNPSNRILNGGKSGGHSVYRLQLAADNATDLEVLENTIETLDNTSNVDFQRILVDPLEPVAQDSESVYHVTSVDIRLYER